MALWAAQVRQKSFHFAQTFWIHAFRQHQRPRSMRRVAVATPFLYGYSLLTVDTSVTFPFSVAVIKAKESNDASISAEGPGPRNLKKEEAKRKRLIVLVDSKNSKEDHQGARQILEEFRAEETGDPRLLWRYSRSLYELSGYPRSSYSPVDNSEDKQLLEKALDLADRAISATVSVGDVGEEYYGAAADAHLWYAIVLEALGQWKNLRERISDAYVIKDHYLKSLQSQPQSAVVLHCLGSWCFTVASINLFERKLAKTVFIDPPSSTYEEALGYFRAAEEVSPNFYSQNLLFIAKCYAHLKNEVKANEYLERVVNFAPIRSDEDADAVKEARRLLLLIDD